MSEQQLHYVRFQGLRRDSTKISVRNYRFDEPFNKSLKRLHRGSVFEKHGEQKISHQINVFHDNEKGESNGRKKESSGAKHEGSGRKGESSASTRKNKIIVC